MITVPSYTAIREKILAEVTNQTGKAVPPDSDVAIRADGMASVAEGIYAHQLWIARQLFVLTCDETTLYTHAERVNMPRQGGSRATGEVVALGAISGVTVPVGAKVTDGQNHYWLTTQSATLIAGQPVTIPIIAEQVGAAWNTSGTLVWVAPVEGQQSRASIVMLSGGSDGEPLERWRARVWEAQKLGANRSRTADIELMLRSIPGVAYAKVYPKRRGAGSLDALIVASSNDGAFDVPGTDLIARAQQVLQDKAAFFEDVRVFAPVVQLLDINCSASGIVADIVTAKQRILDYMSTLMPGDTYSPANLMSRLLTVPGVTDVQLNPNVNITPQQDWQKVVWLRAGNVTVSRA